MGATINLRCKNLELPMSAWGQHRTFHEVPLMSALPPKADIDSNPAARASIFAPMVLLRERTRTGLGIIEPCL
jgi:hypothetical protein